MSVYVKTKQKPRIVTLPKKKVETESPQAGDLTLIRDLIVVGVEKQIYQRAELENIADKEGIFRRKSDGTRYNPSSTYRYLDALWWLKFDDKPVRNNKNIIWSDNAKKLAEYGKANYRTNILSEPEKRILREQIFSSEAKTYFLSCFCDNGDDSVPHNQEQFIRWAHPLYITKIKDNSRKQYVEVRDALKSDKSPIRKPRRDFMTTYRLWCLDTDIIDELNIKEAERCGIVKASSHTLYPVDTSIHIEPDQFLEMLRAEVKGTLRQSVRIPIPWLMYRICPQYKVSVEMFKSFLLETWKLHRNALHLERTAGVLIQFEGRKFFEQDYSNRYGNHRYYVVINGAVRSNLVLLPA